MKKERKKNCYDRNKIGIFVGFLSIRFYYSNTFQALLIRLPHVKRSISVNKSSDESSMKSLTPYSFAGENYAKMSANK